MGALGNRSWLLVLLLAAAMISAAAACGFGKFQCKDGTECVDGRWRCNGDEDCGDGSDEMGCDALPSLALPPNVTATARVRYEADHDGIEIHLCGPEHCSNVDLLGVRGNGTLRYYTWTQCNLLGAYCSLHKLHTEGEGKFPPGELVLHVQHKPGELSLWRTGRPEDVVTVPVGEDYDVLRVRPWSWNIDMPVDFSGDGIRRIPEDQVAAHLKVGSRVVQKWDRKPVPDEVGVVAAWHPHLGVAEVRWPSKGKYNYHMGLNGEYHLDLLDL